MPINRLIPWIAALFLPITGGAHAETAPFAGCASDGQTGPPAEVRERTRTVSDSA